MYEKFTLVNFEVILAVMRGLVMIYRQSFGIFGMLCVVKYLFYEEKYYA